MPHTPHDPIHKEYSHKNISIFFFLNKRNLLPQAPFHIHEPASLNPSRPSEGKQCDNNHRLWHKGFYTSLQTKPSIWSSIDHDQIDFQIQGSIGEQYSSLIFLNGKTCRICHPNVFFALLSLLSLYSVTTFQIKNIHSKSLITFLTMSHNLSIGFMFGPILAVH